MKKLVVILLLLLAVETYGVYGRSQADRITYNCELEVGPLCYQWKKNVLGELIGENTGDELEKKLEEAKKAWEEDFVQKLAEGTKRKNSLDRALQDLKDAFREMKDAFSK
jgi:hypothetical protein